MTSRINPAIWVVLVCAAMWGFWWYPVALFEGAGLTGPWIGMAMSAAALPAAGLWCLFERGGLSGRAVLGCLLVGVAGRLLLRSFASASPIPGKDPYLKESLHYHAG